MDDMSAIPKGNTGRALPLASRLNWKVSEYDLRRDLFLH
jgi:hypothetical protein